MSEATKEQKELTQPSGSPRRVQRKRTKGWRMPKNTVSVCRPGKWGNPYVVGNDGVFGPLSPDAAVALYERHVVPHLPVHELRGKNLACFCPLDQPCHADVLLRWANGKGDSQSPAKKL